jgi:hypothetical protein
MTAAALPDSYVMEHFWVKSSGKQRRLRRLRRRRRHRRCLCIFVLSCVGDFLLSSSVVFLAVSTR